MEEPWGWLVTYAVAFTVLQLVLIYYYLRRDGSDRSLRAKLSSSGSTGGGPSVTESSTESASSREGYRYCSHCGTLNRSRSMYRYCRSCSRKIDS